MKKIHERFSRGFLAEIYGAIFSENRTIPEEIYGRLSKRCERFLLSKNMLRKFYITWVEFLKKYVKNFPKKILSLSNLHIPWRNIGRNSLNNY